MRLAATLLCLTAAMSVLAPTAAATPPPPVGLTVEGGEEAWRSARFFRIVWANPVPSGPAIAAVHYRLRDPAGNLATGATRIGWPATSIEGLEVPGPPGVYTAEVWLEDVAGDLGPPATATLRFDDRRPGSVEPLIGSTWIGRTAFPLPIRLTRPAGAPPVSGIRGYAVSIARPPGSDPCADSRRCSKAETDLRDGPADDTYLVADLPEGLHQVRAVAVSGSGMASAEPGETILRVDKTSPTTSLEGAPTGWTDEPVRLTATAEDEGSGMHPAPGGATPYTAIAIDGAAPIAAAGASVTATVVREGLHRIAHYARDLAGNVDDGGSINGTPNPPPRIATARIDRTPPSLSFVNRQNPNDPELLRVRVADALSGPSAAGWIAVRRKDSGDRFERLPPAPAPNGDLRARWDTDRYAPGEYEFRAAGYDLAGNGTVTKSRADGTAMTLSAPLKIATELRGGFGAGSQQQQRTVAHRRAGVFSGRLATATGRTLGSMPVRIVERFANGLQTRISHLDTDPDGSFALRLAEGPSREVTAIFDGTATLARAASGPALLEVRSGVRLRASSRVARIGGAPLVFRGRVVVAPGAIPADGKSVQLQFRLPGLAWAEFRTIQTDRRGRFRYAYRFSDDDSRGVRFLFRAFAPAQADWAYEPSGSKPVAVRGL